MKDRFGKPIRVGWPAHHIVWIEAALSLPRSERTAAFQDIADMTGRNLTAVQNRAYVLSQEKSREWAATARTLVVPTRSVPCPQPSRYLGSNLRQPDKARLMAGRA